MPRARQRHPLNEILGLRLAAIAEADAQMNSISQTLDAARRMRHEAMSELSRYMNRCGVVALVSLDGDVWRSAPAGQPAVLLAARATVLQPEADCADTVLQTIA